MEEVNTVPRSIKPAILVLTGPTASGKTAIGGLCAQKLNAEIVNADSRQIYKKLNIGTAKPTLEQLALTPYHFISHVDPREIYTAGDFFKEASSKIVQILASGKNVAVVGGSGLYVKVLVDGIFTSPEIDEKIRKQLRDELELFGREKLYKELYVRDPESARRIHISNTPRLLRALEVCRQTGEAFSLVRRLRMPEIPYLSYLTGIRWERSKLYNRIDRRVDEMLDAGFIDEVQCLLNEGLDPSLTALNTVGYKEAIAYLKGIYTYEEMISLMKQHTRNYAKRQLTWFRKIAGMKWYDVDSESDFDEISVNIVHDFLASIRK